MYWYSGVYYCSIAFVLSVFCPCLFHTLFTTLAQRYGHLYMYFTKLSMNNKKFKPTVKKDSNVAHVDCDAESNKMSHRDVSDCFEWLQAQADMEHEPSSTRFQCPQQSQPFFELLAQMDVSSSPKITPNLRLTTTSSVASESGNELSEYNNSKRQRNTESARNCRQKKAESQRSMEHEVKLCADKNQELKVQNASLIAVNEVNIHRVQFLEKQVDQLNRILFALGANAAMNDLLTPPADP